MSAHTLFSATFIYCILHSCDFMLHFKNTFPRSVILNSRRCHNTFYLNTQTHLWPNISVNPSSIQITVPVVKFPWILSVTASTNRNFRKRSKKACNAPWVGEGEFFPSHQIERSQNMKATFFFIYSIYRSATF